MHILLYASRATPLTFIKKGWMSVHHIKKYGLPLLIVFTALFYIWDPSFIPSSATMLFKLIPMWLIIAYAFTLLPRPRKREHWLLITGLIFCMLGDYLLQWFVIGLSAFLIGHLFYISSFVHRFTFTRPRFLTMIIFLVYGGLMGFKLTEALQRNGETALIIPVIFYIIVIITMSWTAIMTGNTLAIVGSILFLISDSILAWNKFVADIDYSSVLIMSTYYAAQLCLARSLGRKNAVNKNSSVDAHHAETSKV